MLSELSIAELLLLAVAAVGIGLSKSGLAGVGLIHVVIFAFVFGVPQFSGVLLPLLIVGDCLAVRLVGREVERKWIARLLPPALVGVVIGWALMGRLDEDLLKRIVGWIILGLTALQTARIWKPGWFSDFPHAAWFAWSLGILAGITTMIANAAGPVVALFLLAVALPKLQLIATGAWFFLILNVLKVPFSIQLGLITWDSLLLNVVLSPLVFVGLVLGRVIVHRLPQRAFDSLLLAFTALAALRLIGLF